MRLFHADTIQEIVDFYNTNKNDSNVYTVQEIKTLYLEEPASDLIDPVEYYENAPVTDVNLFYELNAYASMDDFEMGLQDAATPNANSILVVVEVEEGVYFGEDIDTLNPRRWEVTVKMMDTLIGDGLTMDF